MVQMHERHVGRTFEMIYLDRNNNISQRRIKLHSIHDKYIKAYCRSQRAPRRFKIDHILAMMPVAANSG